MIAATFVALVNGSPRSGVYRSGSPTIPILRSSSRLRLCDANRVDTAKG